MQSSVNILSRGRKVFYEIGFWYTTQRTAHVCVGNIVFYEVGFWYTLIHLALNANSKDIAISIEPSMP